MPVETTAIGAPTSRARLASRRHAQAIRCMDEQVAEIFAREEGPARAAAVVGAAEQVLQSGNLA